MSENVIPVYGKPLELSKLRFVINSNGWFIFQSETSSKFSPKRLIMTLSDASPLMDLVVYFCAICKENSIVERWREHVILDCDMNETEPTTQRICKSCRERIIREG